jgi:tRNA(fMet)-specific endonuclease VapC
VGTLLDTTVFIQFERELRLIPAPRALAEVSQRLVRELGADEEVGMAAITASELLHGVHRASQPNRARREAFVETLLEAFPPIPFDLLAARVHARIWSDLAVAGTDIGAQDRLVAATAIAIGWRVATSNLKHYERVDSLTVVVPNLSA